MLGMLLGLPDPDPLVRSTDPDPSLLIKAKIFKTEIIVPAGKLKGVGSGV
jgi:hypothetical protein